MIYDQLKKFNSEGPYDEGVSFLRHRGKQVSTTVLNKDYENYVTELGKMDYTIYTIKDKQDGRPDLIAAQFYNDPSLFWVILEANNVLSPFEELVVGAKIRIPKL